MLGWSASICSENNALESIITDKFVREIQERTRQNRNRIPVVQYAQAVQTVLC